MTRTNLKIEIVVKPLPRCAVTNLSTTSATLGAARALLAAAAICAQSAVPMPWFLANRRASVQSPSGVTVTSKDVCAVAVFPAMSVADACSVSWPTPNV